MAQNAQHESILSTSFQKAEPAVLVALRSGCILVRNNGGDTRWHGGLRPTGSQPASFLPDTPLH
eukprot:353893-Chlamydomonas_euryale.AAC.12